MSSEETDESLKSNLNDANNSNKDFDVSSTLGGKYDVMKCLNNEPHCAVNWNEIPTCSNYNISVITEDTSGLDLDDDKTENQVSDIVIDLTCDVNSENSELSIGKKGINCDLGNLDSNQSVVPVTNSEIARTDNQKLVSLSLSILLAALFQAVRCFAQFLEDIVVPQR